MGQLRSYKLVNRTAPFKLVGSFISLYPACPETQYSPTMCQVGLSNTPYGLSHGMVIQSQFVSGAELAIRFVNFSHVLEG